MSEDAAARRGYDYGLREAERVARGMADKWPDDIFPPESGTPDAIAAGWARRVCTLIGDAIAEVAREARARGGP